MKFTERDYLHRRVLMTIFGVLVCGSSVGFYSYSSMGLDPFQVFCHGIWNLTDIGYGTFSVFLLAIMLVIIFFWNRSKIGLGTVINMFLIGYATELVEWLLYEWNPNPSLTVRTVSLVIGVIIMCLSSSIYFTADMGVSVYDAVALTISERHPKLKFQYIRISTDAVCVLIGGLLGATVGIGTLIAAFFMGPLIAFFNKKISLPLLYGGKEKVPEDKR